MQTRFQEILNESKKTYPFKVGIAGTLPEGFADSLETCLKKYDIANISSGKKTPIQERPLDFPQLQNMEVTYFEVELHYPTTSQVLEEYIEKCCPCEPNHVIVRGANDPKEEYQAPKASEPYESMLQTEDMGGDSAQEAVATNRVMDLLKELEVARKERNNDPMDSAPAGESKDITDSENTKAVVGG